MRIPYQASLMLCLLGNSDCLTSYVKPSLKSFVSVVDWRFCWSSTVGLPYQTCRSNTCPCPYPVLNCLAVMKAVAAVAVGVMFRRCTLVLPLFHYLCHFHTKRAKGKQGIGGREGRRGSRSLPNENIGSRTAGGERLKNRHTTEHR